MPLVITTGWSIGRPVVIDRTGNAGDQTAARYALLVARTSSIEVTPDSTFSMPS